MPIESVEQYAALRQSALDGQELSLEQLREVADWVRAQRGVRGPKKGSKPKAKVETLNTDDALAKMFGL